MTAETTIAEEQWVNHTRLVLKEKAGKRVFMLAYYESDGTEGLAEICNIDSYFDKMPEDEVFKILEPMAHELFKAGLNVGTMGAAEAFMEDF